MRRDEDYTKLVGQHVQLVITECAGRKIVGSINKVTAEANKDSARSSGPMLRSASSIRALSRA